MDKSFQEKMEIAQKNRERREAGLAKPRKPKTRSLSIGEFNILAAKLISDVWAKGLFNDDAYKLIDDYYVHTLKMAAPSKNKAWELAKQSKELFLTNFNMPNLENYKKEQFNKAEQMEREIKQNSKKDPVDKSKSVVEVWKYKDKMVGLDESNGIDILIGVNTQPTEIIKALEVDED